VRHRLQTFLSLRLIIGRQRQATRADTRHKGSRDSIWCCSRGVGNRLYFYLSLAIARVPSHHGSLSRFLAIFFWKSVCARRVDNGRYDGTVASITEYEDGAAMLELRTQFKAEGYPFIKFDVKVLTTWSVAYVFWQGDDDPAHIHRLELNRSRGEDTQMAMPYGGKIF